MRLFASRQQSLVLAAGLLSVVMLPVVLFLTSVVSPLTGYISTLAIYWVFFCLPVSVVMGRGPNYVSVELALTPPWIPVVALALPIAVFLVAGPTAWLGADTRVLALAIGCALANAPLEELAWRRAFRANSDGRLRFEILGLVLFTLWHVPLSFSRGIDFDYGIVGLVGGAFFLGTVWVFLTRAANSVGWPILSHVLVNLAAFVPFFASNASQHT